MTSILERSFNFNGFNCYVIMRHMGDNCYRCGYVQVSKRLPINTASINCHGGITYANKEAPSPLEIDDKNSGTLDLIVLTHLILRIFGL